MNRRSASRKGAFSNRCFQHFVAMCKIDTGACYGPELGALTLAVAIAAAMSFSSLNGWIVGGISEACFCTDNIRISLHRSIQVLPARTCTYQLAQHPDSTLCYSTHTLSWAHADSHVSNTCSPFTRQPGGGCVSERGRTSVKGLSLLLETQSISNMYITGTCERVAILSMYVKHYYQHILQQPNMVVSVALKHTATKHHSSHTACLRYLSDTQLTILHSPEPVQLLQQAQGMRECKLLGI